MSRVAKSFLPLISLCLSFSVFASAQNTEALRQTFHAPKTDIEQALKDLNAYQGGKLPFVEGFVGSTDQSLAKYQRAYYQYSIEVMQASDSEVSVAVNAKISAWYDDNDSSKAGYRDLPSNGRLEADLLDRLRARLRKNAADVAASRTPLVSPKLLGTTQPPPDTTPSAPEPPSAAASSPPSNTFRPFASAAAAVTPSQPLPNSAVTNSDARYQRLVQEEKSLNEVLAAQQRPDNLVAVKAPHTPITAAPAEGARVLMYADAEDEFQFLKTQGEWTHVQISGINRGWIRSSQIDVLGTTKSGVVAATASEQFRQTKEETSTFPGDWTALRGKSVRIIWVQPNGKSTQKSRLNYAESIFRKQAPQISSMNGVEGVVIVFDSAEGGMAATTLAALQQWGSGTMSDAAFLKQCWFDPADAFTGVLAAR